MSERDSGSEESTDGSLTVEEEQGEDIEEERLLASGMECKPLVISERQRRKYNEALRELYELARLRREELETGESGGDEMENNRSEMDAVGREMGSVPPRLEDIHRELMEISRKLQMENEKLYEREVELRQRETNVEEMEAMVRDSHNLLEKCAEQEVNKRWTQMTEKHELERTELEESVKQKVRENKRLKTSFETVRQTNDTLKQQLVDVQERNQKLESQLVSVQRRLTNLQRKSEFALRQQAAAAEIPSEDHMSAGHQTHRQTPSGALKSQKAAIPLGVFEVVAFLFEWITSVHQRERERTQRTQSLVFTQERCCKILPRLSDLLPILPSGNSKLHYPCLQFVFWSLMHLEEGGRQKMALSSTLRRIGEELYQPMGRRVADTSSGSVTASGQSGERVDVSHKANFFHSHSLHVRLLSSLIILKTLTQVDHLAHVFDSLRSELKEDAAKDLFLQHRGVSVILPYLKMTHRGLMASAVDVFLQLSMESAFLPRFLEHCSNEEYFHLCSTLLHDPKLDVKLQEKLCIILQRLSKIRANHKLFEMFQLGRLLQDMLRCANPEDAFLTLNLRSILLNLNLLTH